MQFGVPMEEKTGHKEGKDQGFEILVEIVYYMVMKVFSYQNNITSKITQV